MKILDFLFYYLVKWFKKRQQKFKRIDPIEKTWIDHNLWRWEYADYNKGYMVVADVARGDGGDYSACHVFDIETATQVAEYKGKIDTKDLSIIMSAK